LQVNLHLVENPRDSLEGANESFKNTEKLPKGPSFPEGAKISEGVLLRGEVEGGRGNENSFSAYR
jgi:hypothetical protein